MPQVLDYSAGLPGAAAIKRAGYVGAVRYIGFPANPKCTNAGELRDFTAHGLGMALVFEQTADNWRGGYNAGVADYRTGRTHANMIGFPMDRPIYMAVDRDVVTTAEMNAALAYLRGARDAAGRPGLVGVYGEHDVCAAAAAWRGPSDDRLCDWFWQCRAWSGTPPRMFGRRHLYQHAGTVYVGGIACDINDVLATDWGQHLEDTMSEEAAYTGVAKMFKDMGSGAAPDLVQALREVVWGGLVPVKDGDAEWLDRADVVLAATNRHAAHAEFDSRVLRQEVDVLKSANAALAELVAKGGGLTVEAVKQAVHDAVAAGVVKVDVTVQNAKEAV